jgi:hypothetical protein
MVKLNCHRGHTMLTPTAIFGNISCTPFEIFSFKSGQFGNSNLTLWLVFIYSTTLHSKHKLLTHSKTVSTCFFSLFNSLCQDSKTIQTKIKYYTDKQEHSHKNQTDNHQNTTLYKNNSIKLLSHYYIKLCFDGCQVAFCLYLQHSGMCKVKKTVTQHTALLALIIKQ